MWHSRRIKRVLTSFSAITVATVGMSLSDVVENNTYGPVSFEIVDKVLAEAKTDMEKAKPPKRIHKPQNHYGPPPVRRMREVKVLWGDTNSNGGIDKNDALKIQDYINGKLDRGSIDVSVADVNDDGKVDIKDFDYINAYLAGISIVGNRTGKLKEIVKKPLPVRRGGAPPPRPMGVRRPLPREDNHKLPPKLDKKAALVEDTEIRSDGKAICNTLREKRLELARINNIAFKSDICPNVEPCAGTCPKCEAEAEYLKAQLKKLPKDRIIYPKLDVSAFK